MSPNIILLVTALVALGFAMLGVPRVLGVTLFEYLFGFITIFLSVYIAVLLPTKKLFCIGPGAVKLPKLLSEPPVLKITLPL